MNNKDLKDLKEYRISMEEHMTDLAVEISVLNAEIKASSVPTVTELPEFDSLM